MDKSPYTTENTEDLQAHIMQIEAWLDNLRQKLCACGTSHMDPAEHIRHCPYRHMAAED